MTPNEIDVLMHCYTSPMIHERFEAPAVQEAIGMLLALGAVEKDSNRGDDQYRTTNLGRAWVEAICNVPVPTAVFLDKDGKPITW